MKTSKPFSTISYNTPEFLRSKLQQLVDTRKILFFAFIPHLAEAEETKNHIHLFIEPNGQIQTDMFYNYLAEISPVKADLKPSKSNLKPLGIMPIRSSKFADWYFYGIHDKNYLTTKMLIRAYHYKKTDITCSNTDYLNELVAMSTPSNLKQKQIIDLLSLGYTAVELARKGVIPINQLGAYNYMSNEMLYNSNSTEEKDKEQEIVALTDKALPF